MVFGVDPTEGGVGPEMLKLLATQKFVSYQPLVTRDLSRGKGPSDPFARLIYNFSNGRTRSNDDTPPPGSWTTDQVTFVVHR